mgnify:FL=1
MNSITRKLITGMLSLAFSFVALGTVTFAWFTLTNITTLAPFELDVSTVEGIEVALGDETYSDEWFSDVPNHIFLSYLESLGYDNSFGLGHVTSPDGVNFIDFKSINVNDRIKGGYLEFQLRFRSLVGGQNIYITNNTGILSNPIAWKADATFHNSKGTLITAGEVVNYNVANAVRMSFASGDNVIVYELPDSEDNTAQGSSPQIQGAVEYYNTKHSLNPISIDGVVLANTITSFVGAPAVVTLPKENPIDGFYQATITIRIWIEGWDSDCIDALMQKKLTIALEFSTIKPE